MKYLILFLSFVSATSFSQIADNQNWNQLGSELVGGPINDISLSKNGKIIAVGFWLDSINNTNYVGIVRVFVHENESWSQLGEDIVGISFEDYFGYSVSLSDDGYTLAIGSPNSDEGGIDEGVVKVYSFDEFESNWVQLGNNIYGTPYNRFIGHSVSLSSDGKTIAFGVPMNSNYFDYKGHVEVYRFNESSHIWNQLGDLIMGEFEWDETGHSVSISSDGNIIAIGAPKNWSDWPGSNTGSVRVYKFNFQVNNWVQLGNDINGKFIDEWFGSSTSISSNGNIIAIGGYRNSQNHLYSGRASVFKFNNMSNQWEQLGQDIYGDSEDDWTGYSVTLSSSGYVLAVSSPYDNQLGSVSVYSFNQEVSEWSLIGDKITSNDTLTNFGNSLSLSKNGDTLSVSATNYSYGGYVKSFFFQNLGCTDIVACNYDSTAVIDNGSCLYSTNSNFDVISCEAYEWNGNLYNTSGIYTYTTTNYVGCDSVATLNLTISNPSTNESFINSCENSFLWNGITLNYSGTYIYNFTNQHGCDSISILHLSIQNSTTSILDTSICDNSFFWNDNLYTSSGVYSYNTTNELGCDSVAILDLTLHEKPDSIFIEQYWSTTLMTEERFFHQWYLNDSPILNENSSILNISQGGSYVVESIDSVGCKTLSEPFVIGNLLKSIDKSIDFNVYPNPTNNIVNVDIEGIDIDANIIISDHIGQTLKTIKLKDSKSNLIDISHLDSGSYTITIKLANGLNLSKTIVKI